MLPQYHDARHEVRNTIIGLVEDLANSNKLALKAIEECNAEALDEARKNLKEMSSITEKIDNDIVLIFAKFTPGAK
ncbi:MAG: Unknown protein, partial [uncultured Sulfurovum sp.]